MIKKNLIDIMERQLPKRVLDYLARIGKIAQRQNTSSYLVGGVIRDLLLKVDNLDLDIVVERDGLALARVFADRFGGFITVHNRFYTANVGLRDGIKIDFATARRESYDRPGALPKVEKGSIEEDLARRDFSINAIAVKLDPGEFGRLVDFCGGIEDIHKQKIRVLHDRSFIDDPTRIFRAIRFEQRYQFSLDKFTETLLEGAIKNRLQKAISFGRLKDELVLILNEVKPIHAIRRMSEVGLLRYIHPKMRLTSRILSLLGKTEDTFFLFALPLLEHVLKHWLVYFMVMLEGLISTKLLFTKLQRDKIIKGWDLSNRLLKILKRKNLADSEIYKGLKRLPNEVILLAMIKTKSRLAMKRVFNYLNNLQNTSVHLTGKDLIKMGYKPGPHFRNIIGALLTSKLDGTISSREEEKKFVIDNFPRE